MNIFKKKIAVYNILSELMDKLDYLEKDANSDVKYSTEELEKVTDETDWRIDSYKRQISEAEERIDAIAQVRKYIESYNK